MMIRKFIKSINETCITKVYDNYILSRTFSINVSSKNPSQLGIEINEQNKTKSTIQNSKLEKSNIINDTNLGLTYTKIDNKNDKLLTELLLTARNKKYRNKNSQIVIEGRRLIIEALTCGVELKKIIFSQKDELLLIKEELLKLPEYEIYRVPHHKLKLWSALTTQPGLLGIFNQPSNIPLKQLNSSEYVPITVICDNIREPNNIGSIIRICAALPCSKIIVLKGCCDPWETKALRSGCGGHFRINIETNFKWEDMNGYLPEDASVFIADNNILNMEERLDNVKEYSEVKISKNNYLIIGGETHGISEEAYKLVKFRKGNGIHIPLANNVDSLNTASALSLILFTLRQNRINMNLESN